MKFFHTNLVGIASLTLMIGAASAGDMSGNTAYFLNKGEITVLPGTSGQARVGLRGGTASFTREGEAILGSNVTEGGKSTKNSAYFENHGRVTVQGSLIAGSNVAR